MSFPVCESVNYSFKKFNHRNTLLLELLRTSCVHDRRNSSVVPWCISYNSDHPLSIFHWNEFRPKLRSWVSAFFWTWIDSAMFSLPQQSMAVSGLHQVLFLRRDSSHRIDCAHINSEEYEEPTKQDSMPFTNHETNLVNEVLEEPTRWNAVPFTKLRKDLGARSTCRSDKTRCHVLQELTKRTVLEVLEEPTKRDSASLTPIEKNLVHEVLDGCTDKAWLFSWKCRWQIEKDVWGLCAIVAWYGEEEP